MSPEKWNQVVILWYIYFALWCIVVVVSETCEVVLIFTKDTASIFVGQEKIVLIF